jgi:hypothetical protein
MFMTGSLGWTPKACHIPEGYPVPLLSTGGARALGTTGGAPPTFGDYVDAKYMQGRRAMWTGGREGRTALGMSPHVSGKKPEAFHQEVRFP